MKRGRRPLSRAVKIARGTLRPCRDIAAPSQIACGSVPIKPTILTKGGARVWDDVIDGVIRAGHSTVLDSMMLGVFCNSMASLKQMREPRASLINELRKWAVQFGLLTHESRPNSSRGNNGQDQDNQFGNNG